MLYLTKDYRELLAGCPTTTGVGAFLASSTIGENRPTFRATIRGGGIALLEIGLHGASAFSLIQVNHKICMPQALNCLFQLCQSGWRQEPCGVLTLYDQITVFLETQIIHNSISYTVQLEQGRSPICYPHR